MYKMDRRVFLKSASLLGAGAMLNVSCKGGGAGSKAASRKHKRFGLQVYGVCVELAQDIPAGFAKLKEAGYDTLELAGYQPDGSISLFHDPIPLADYRRMALDAGLEITSSHARAPQRFFTRENMGEVVDFWKKVAEHHAGMGVKYLVQAAIPTVRSMEEAQLVAEVFNEAGKAVRDAGMLFTFHNEPNAAMRVVPGGTEPMFTIGRYPRDARQIYDILLEETDPSLVYFELDGFAAILGGNDPLLYLQKYPERMILMHVKDREALGASGMINHEIIFRQFHANGMTDFFVEDENVRSGHQFERVAESARYLQDSDFV